MPRRRKPQPLCEVPSCPAFTVGRRTLCAVHLQMDWQALQAALKGHPGGMEPLKPAGWPNLIEQKPSKGELA